LIRLYWDIGRTIDAIQNQGGWGAGVIPRLAKDLRNELPEVKGFSERNIGLMISFFRAYPQPQAILQQPVAKLEAPADSAQPQAILPQPVAKLAGPAVSPRPGAKAQQPDTIATDDSLLWSIPWGHHAIFLAI
jgi:hypothetical protein